jgi:hypothetical protein
MLGAAARIQWKTHTDLPDLALKQQEKETRKCPCRKGAEPVSLCLGVFRLFRKPVSGWNSK